MVDSNAIQAYLKALSRRYGQWRRDNALTETIAAQQATFTFEQFVKTEDKQPGKQPQEKTLPLFQGIRDYLGKGPVLLVGSPGIGKSSALWYCLYELAKEELESSQPRIPVLVQLKGYRDGFVSSEDPSGMLALIQASIRPYLRLSIPEIYDLLCQPRLILLIDGLNEMPAGAFRTHLKTFREECQELEIPLICSTRELGGGDLGIQRKLEIQALNHKETERFLQECLPAHQEQVRQLLQRDNRELSRTPFVLWMLYHLLKETGTVAETLGESFRQFFRFHLIRHKEDAPVPEDRRKNWNLWMEHLAFSMLSSPDPLDPGLVITREDAETILSQRFGELHGTPSRIYELEKYHLIELVSDRQISFKHQLIQEYYAAEHLFTQLHGLIKHETKDYNAFQAYYLNYLKWTEAISILLGLLGSNKEALEIISFALKVDVFLGAELSKDIQASLQPKALEKIAELDLLPKLKLQLLGLTRSTAIVATLSKILKSHSHKDMHLIAVDALGKIKSPEALSILAESLKHENICVRLAAVLISRHIDSEQSVDIMLQALLNEEDLVRDLAASKLSETRHREKVWTQLQKILRQGDNPYKYSISIAIERFNEKSGDDSYEYFTPFIILDSTFLRIDNPDYIDPCDDEISLAEALKSKDPNVQLRALYRATSLKIPSSLSCLGEMLAQPSNKSITGNIINAIKTIQSSCGFYSYEIQQSMISKEGILKMASKPGNDFRGATFNAPVNFGENPTGDFINTQNNYANDPEVQSTISDLKTLLAQLQAQHPSVSTESEALVIIDAEFTEIQKSPSHRLATLRRQLLNPERHLQAAKAAAGEVAKHYLEDSVWAKSIITYLDKLSEEPNYGA